MNHLFLLRYRNAHNELTPMEQAIKSVVESPLSVEILCDVFRDIINLSDDLASGSTYSKFKVRRGIRKDEIISILKQELNDWDK